MSESVLAASDFSLETSWKQAEKGTLSPFECLSFANTIQADLPTCELPTTTTTTTITTTTQHLASTTTLKASLLLFSSRDWIGFGDQSLCKLSALEFKNRDNCFVSQSS